MESVTSLNDFRQKAGSCERALLLLYKSGSEASDCAYKNLTEATEFESEELKIFTADTTAVRDIHQAFSITSAPSLLVFKKGEFINAIKGCHDASYFRSVAENAVFMAKAEAAGTEMKSVTVYSTPTCTWCNTLKTWLRKNNVFYTEIDVSRDSKAAEEMVSRSGQQGVPQTDINGQMVIGFDQKRLKELLEI